MWQSREASADQSIFEQASAVTRQALLLTPSPDGEPPPRQPCREARSMRFVSPTYSTVNNRQHRSLSEGKSQGCAGKALELS